MLDVWLIETVSFSGVLNFLKCLSTYVIGSTNVSTYQTSLDNNNLIRYTCKLETISYSGVVHLPNWNIYRVLLVLMLLKIYLMTKFGSNHDGDIIVRY